MSIFDRAIDRASRVVGDVLLLPDATREQMEAGDRALAEGRGKDAERLFRTVLEERPGVLRAQIGWARALAATGDVAAARIAVAEARIAEPDDPTLALLSARFSLEEGDTGAASTSAREAARRLAPGLEEARSRRPARFPVAPSGSAAGPSIRVARGRVHHTVGNRALDHDVDAGRAFDRRAGLPAVPAGTGEVGEEPALGVGGAAGVHRPPVAEEQVLRQVPGGSPASPERGTSAITSGQRGRR